MAGINEEPRLADLCSNLLLFLTTFRRTARQVDTDPAWLRRKLITLFEELATRTAGNAERQRLYEKARFPLVALADEIALNTEWKGRDLWEEELLEQHFYGTSVAGELFYDRLKETGPEEDQLVEVFFLCLALGFKGKLRSRPEERRELLQNLYSRLPGRIAKKSDLLFPAAYEQNVEKDLTKLPVLSAARVAVILAGAILLAFFASDILTRNIVQELSALAQSIASGGTAVTTGAEK